MVNKCVIISSMQTKLKGNNTTVNVRNSWPTLF